MRFQRKSEASQRGHQPFNPWTTTFAQVYVHEQKKWLAKDGSVGPLWLYASNQRTLFMSYIARKNRPFDWEKAEAVDLSSMHCFVALLPVTLSARHSQTSFRSLAPCSWFSFKHNADYLRESQRSGFQHALVSERLSVGYWVPLACATLVGFAVPHYCDEANLLQR